MQSYEPRDQNTFPGHVPHKYDPELFLRHASFQGLFFDTEDFAPFLASGIVPTRRAAPTPEQMRPPLDRSAFRVSGSAELDGRRQLVLRTAASPNDARSYVEVWVDPALGYQVTRWAQFGPEHHEYELRYVSGSTGWTLNSWKWSWWSNDRLCRWSLMNVRTCEVNPAVDTNEFHVEPRTGMIIQDDRSDRGRLYVKGGPGEADLDVRNAMAREPSRRLAWFASVAAVIVCGAILVSLFARRRVRNGIVHKKG